MTELNTREIAEHWFHIMKSAPYADDWKIEDTFVEKLTTIWPWLQVYFDVLDMLEKKSENFLQATTLGAYGLQQTLGLRFDGACALFMLLFLSRYIEQIPPQKKDETLKYYADIIEQLVKDQNEKAKGIRADDAWLKWFEGQWQGEGGH